MLDNNDILRLITPIYDTYRIVQQRLIKINIFTVN